jgi:ABC-type uncharacterized transport system permease subunit
MLASLGGAYLALDQHQFTDQMTAGAASSRWRR